MLINARERDHANDRRLFENKVIHGNCCEIGARTTRRKTTRRRLLAADYSPRRQLAARQLAA
jgi:hypothetical protein